jgi:tetratricopeptide (TPR) repeat protein
MDKKIRSLLWEAEYHIKSNWILSVEILEDIIKKAPQTFAAYEMLYGIFMRQTLYKKAEKVLNRAISYFPNSDHLFFLMGNLYLAQRGKAWKAIEWYQRAKHKFPELEFNLAVALVYQKRRQEAVLIFKKVFPYFNKLLTSYTFLAEQYIALKDFDKAITLLAKAEKRFPASKDIFYLKGICYNEKHNWISAYLCFEKAKELGCSSAGFFNTLAGCCQNMGDIEKTITYFKQSISQNIFFIKSYIDLSKLYISENDLLSAQKYLNIARKIDPLNIYVALASEKLKQISKDRDKL